VDCIKLIDQDEMQMEEVLDSYDFRSVQLHVLTVESGIGRRSGLARGTSRIDCRRHPAIALASGTAALLLDDSCAPALVET